MSDKHNVRHAHDWLTDDIKRLNLLGADIVKSHCRLCGLTRKRFVR